MPSPEVYPPGQEDAFNKTPLQQLSLATPEIQRSSEAVSVVTNAVTTDTTIIINDSEVAAEEQLYIWGVSFCTSSTELVTGKLEAHDASTDYILFGASRNSNFQWTSNLPFVVDKGEGIQLTNAVGAATGAQLSDTVSTITVWYNKVLLTS